MVRATRYHDISTGHRVHGQGGKCEHLHGHNYRVHFSVESKTGLDSVGRVLDFSVIKEILCEWLERHWDHKFLIWANDPWAPMLQAIDETVVFVPFNPTAENMAEHLVEKVAPMLLPPQCTLAEVVIEETAKCSCTYVREGI